MLCIAFMKLLIRWLGVLLSAIIGLTAAAWAFGAVWFDGPFGAGNKPAAALLTMALLAVLIFVRPFWRKLGTFVLLLAGVLIWWLTLAPTNESDWQPDVARLAWADVQGDEVTFHNVRNCDYRTEMDYTPHWETRTVRLSQITGIDLAINYWGSHIPSPASNSPKRRRSASPSRRASSSARSTRPSGRSTGRLNSFTSLPTNAT